MYTKQEIIIRSYREGKSQRCISRELQVSRKTISMYIEDYENLKKGLIRTEIALSTYLTSHPLYRIGTRSKVRLTREIQAIIDANNGLLLCEIFVPSNFKNFLKSTFNFFNFIIL